MLLIIFSGTGFSILRTTDVKNLSNLDKSLYSLGLGFGIYGMTIFILGIVGLLRGPYLLLLLFAGSILTLKNIGFFKKLADSVISFKTQNLSYFTKFLLATTAIFFVLNTFLSLAPIHKIDSIAYHFTLPKQYLEAGRIFEIEGYFYSHFPQHSEMINLFIMALRSDISATLYSSYFGILCAALLFSIARKYFSKETALLSATLFYSSSFVSWVVAGNFVEPAWTFLALLSFHSLTVYLEKKSTTHLILSGIFLGIAFSCKFLAVYCFAAISLYFIYKGLSDKGSKHRLLVDVPLWLGMIIITGLPWYMKNLLMTGNSFFPLFFETLGGKGWTNGVNEVLLSSMYSFGYGRSILSFISLPFTMTLKGTPFFHGFLIGPLILSFSPFALLDKVNIKKVLLLCSIAFVYVFLWFMGTQQARFLFPILPVLMLLTVLGFEKIVKFHKKWVGHIAKFIIVLFIISSFRVVVSNVGRSFKVVTGMETKDEFLSKMAPDYVPALWMNENLKKDDKVLFYGFGQYYLNIPYMAGGYGVQGNLDYSAFKNTEAFYQKVRSLGITHVYNLDQYIYFREVPLWKEFANKHLEKIFEDRRTLISKSPLAGGSRIVGTVYRLK